MDIRCPSCGLTGRIEDSRLRAAGSAVNCPRCKTSFRLDRPSPPAQAAPSTSVSSPLATDANCRVCGAVSPSGGAFSICPVCGTNAAPQRESLFSFLDPFRSLPLQAAVAGAFFILWGILLLTELRFFSRLHPGMVKSGTLVCAASLIPILGGVGIFCRNTWGRDLADLYGRTMLALGLLRIAAAALSWRLLSFFADSLPPGPLSFAKTFAIVWQIVPPLLALYLVSRPEVRRACSH